MIFACVGGLLMGVQLVVVNVLRAIRSSDGVTKNTVDVGDDVPLINAVDQTYPSYMSPVNTEGLGDAPIAFHDSIRSYHSSDLDASRHSSFDDYRSLTTSSSEDISPLIASPRGSANRYEQTERKHRSVNPISAPLPVLPKKSHSLGAAKLAQIRKGALRGDSEFLQAVNEERKDSIVSVVVAHQGTSMTMSAGGIPNSPSVIEVIVGED